MKTFIYSVLEINFRGGFKKMTYAAGKTFPGTAFKPRVFRYKGSFDWVYFYQGLHRYFDNKRYYLNESRFKDTGKAIKLDITAEREVDEWLLVKYGLKFIMYNLKREKIKVNGETREIMTGMLEVSVSGTYTMDRKTIFNLKNPFQKILAKLFVMMKSRDWEVGVQDGVDYGSRQIIIEMRRLLNTWTKDAHSWGYTPS